MIGLSSLSLDSCFLIKDAAGISIKDFLFLVWTRNSFSLGNLKEFQTTLRESKRGSQLALSLEFKQWDSEILKIEFYDDALVIADTQRLSIWNQKISSSVQVNNLKTFLLNPDFKPHICATLSENGKVAFYDLNDLTKVDLPCENVMCITWSRKGKQIACGTKAGEIIFYNTNTDLKKNIPKPEQLSESYQVQFIEWLEDRSFLVIYVSQDKEIAVFQILEDKETKQQLFINLEDPAASFGCDRDPFYFCHVLKSWDFDNLLILANSASTDVGLIGSATDSSHLANWEALEAYQFTMPLDEEQDDTWPISTALDLYSDQLLPSLTPDQPPMPSCPILWILNNKGMLMACDILSTMPLEKGIQYPFMVKDVTKTLTLNTSSGSAGKVIAPISLGKQALDLTEKPKFTIETKSKALASPADQTSIVTSKPLFSLPKNSIDNSLKLEKKAEVIKESEVKLIEKSLSILLTQFNKAYEDFQFDMSKLGKFMSGLKMLAQADVTSIFSDISQMSSQAGHLEERLSMINGSLMKTDEHFEDVKSHLLHSWTKKEESDRLLKILRSPEIFAEKDKNICLGPEAEELKKLLNRKKKRIESSIADLNEVLEDLRERAESQKRGKKLLGPTHNWYTLCTTVQRITSSAIQANVSLDDLEKKMNQMSVSSRQRPQNKDKENYSPSKSPYGLIKVEDVLAEDLTKIVPADSNTVPSQSNLMTLLMSDKYTPSISVGNSTRPTFRAQILVNGTSAGSSAVETNAISVEEVDASGNVANKASQPRSCALEVEKSATLAEKINKLDSTPPSKNEYIRPSSKVICEAPKIGLLKEVRPPANSFSPANLKKIENPDQPSISSISINKPIAGFQSFVASSPKVDALIFSTSTDLSSITPKEKFDAKDDSENPFLVASKGPTSLFGSNGFKLPEPKALMTSPKAPIFSFPSASNSSVLIAESVDKKIPTTLNHDSKPPEIHDIKLDMIPPKESVSEAREIKVEDEVEFQSSTESEKAGELVNEDGDDAEVLSEIILTKDESDQALKLDSLDILGASKPKNIVNPMFSLTAKSENNASVIDEDKVEQKVSGPISKTDAGSSDSIEIEYPDIRGPPSPEPKLEQTNSTLGQSSNIFGQSSANVFGTSIGNSIPAFGQAAFTTSAPSFVQSTTMSTPITLAKSETSFGQPLAFGTPASVGPGLSNPGFGQTSVFGAPNKSVPSTPAFGQSAPSFAQATPAFGQSNSSFLQSTPVFGQSATGFAQPTSGFGPSSGFGNGNNASITESANKSGQPLNHGFGSLSKPSFGQSNVSVGMSSANSFAALSGVSSPSPAPSSFAGIAQGGFTKNQGFNAASVPSTASLGPGQSLAGNVAFGARSGIGSNAPAFSLPQSSFPNVSGAQSVFGASVGSSNPTFGGGAPAASSGFAAFATSSAPAASFGSVGNNQMSGFGSAAQAQQNTSIFGSSSQTSTGFGSGSFNSGFGQTPNNTAFSQHRG